MPVATLAIKTNTYINAPAMGVKHILGKSIVVTSEEVQEIIYDFAQRSFIGEKGNGKLNLSKEKVFFEFLSNNEIDQIKAHQLSENHRKLLRELLSQYIMFLQMNSELSFPTGFLAGSSNNVLGRALLDYMCEHKWPFPQLLDKYRR